MNKGKMKTINLNAEPDYDIVLIPHYSEANNCWWFLLILEREVVSAACFIQLNSKRARECQKEGNDLQNSLFQKIVRLLIMLIMLRDAYFNHFGNFFPPQRNVK